MTAPIRPLFDALNAANAIRPVDRRGRVGLYGWGAALLTSELPREALALEVLMTGRALRRGTLTKRGAALQGLSWAQLAYLNRSAQGSAAVLETALHAALGDDFPMAQPTPGVVPAHVGLARTFGLRRRYVRHEQLSYGPAGTAHLLDIWRHPDTPTDGRAPVVLQVPGGAWVTGSKETQAYPLLSHLAELGWVCVAISYRLAPRHPWPAQIVDVKRAIRWVRDNIGAHGGDPEFLALTGGSAGGHLTALAALTANDPAYQPGFEDADTTIEAAVPYYGVYDFTDREGIGHSTLVPFLQKRVVQTRFAATRAVYDAASPMSRVHAGAPPMFVLHGSNDSIVPVEQADAFVKLLRGASSAPVGYARLPHAQHAFDLFGSVRAHHAASASARFLGHVWSQR